MRDIIVFPDQRDPFAHFALEAALFEESAKPCDALLLYVCTPCIVIGRNQNPWVEVSASAGLPVVRRISGGGAVYMDEGNLNWAFLSPKEKHDRCAELSFVASALAEFGVDAAADERGALRLVAPKQFAGAKISGSARRILGDRVLHHGTLLVDADLRRMDASLGGMKVLSSNAPPSVPSQVANLSDVVPGLGIDELASALSRGAAGREREAYGDLVDTEKVMQMHRKLRSWDWIWGATPSFTIELCEGRARMTIVKGRLASVTGPAAAILADSLGQAFDYEFPLRAEKLIRAC